MLNAMMIFHTGIAIIVESYTSGRLAAVLGSQVTLLREVTIATLFR